jgi:hypothetical protein
MGFTWQKQRDNVMLMSDAEIIVRYDGPALSDHKMDVEQLAPAMLALGELAKRANYLANGNRASVKVLVRVDVEQHCIQYGIEIVQDILQAARGLLDDENIKTAKDLAEWMGIITGVTGSSVVGLYGILKLLRGRRPDETKMVVQDGKDVVQIMAGRDVILAHPMAMKLFEDREILQSAKSTTKPLENEEYESLEFHSEDRAPQIISREDAASIALMPEPVPEVASLLPPSSIKAWVKIRTAVYEGAGKWKVQHDRSRDVTMNDLEWLEKFQRNEVQAPPGSMLHVEMSVSEIELDRSGKPIRDPDYAIEKVLNVEIPPETPDMFELQAE